MRELDNVTMSALVDEVEKIAGFGSFLTRGIKGWGRLATSNRGLGTHWRGIKNIARKGYQKGGAWEAAKRLGRSRYGAMAGTGAIGGLAGYGAYKAVTGDRSRQY